MDKVIKIISRKYTDYMSALVKAFSKNDGYFCNMYIMSKYMFDNYMKFLFDVLFELRGELGKNEPPRIYGYLSECIFNCYLEYIKQTSDIKINECEILMLN